MSPATRTDLLVYGAVGVIATPIALEGGELYAALFCIAAVLGFHILRHRLAKR
ncbi:MAG TPA: hypothetical protein VFQ53_33710 [Kofleriaceae bacterium]|nr:hypothetical protein [Kofleriaceae bacterium]